MRLLQVVSIVVILPGIVGQIDPSVPGCAINCWENTKYVSKCSTDISCLCSELNYQNSVYQCLYSQCDTTHFGSALHHVIAQCFGTGNEILFAAPPIPNREELRRREAVYAAGAKLYGSGGSDVGYPTESANYPTQSANYPTQSVGGPYSPSPTDPALPLETATSPALTSATPTPPPYSALPETTSAAPVLYTGSSASNSPSTWLALWVTVVVIISMY